MGYLGEKRSFCEDVLDFVLFLKQFFLKHLHSINFAAHSFAYQDYFAKASLAYDSEQGEVINSVLFFFRHCYC